MARSGGRAGGEPAPIDEADALVYGEETEDELGNLLLPNIRWVFFGGSGTNGVIERGWVTSERKWTSARGLFGVAVAEHALALMLAGSKCLSTLTRARRWMPPPDDALLVAGKRALVIGAGDIALALVPRLKALGLDVTILVRTPQIVRKRRRSNYSAISYTTHCRNTISSSSRCR